jgi:pyridinium-3,5-biscarboxylic acid mononucleotide synthase
MNLLRPRSGFAFLTGDLNPGHNVRTSEVKLDPEAIRKLLEGVQKGDTSVDNALESLRSLPFEDIGDAQVDHHRALRTGFPEVILGSGKTAEQIVAVAKALDAHGANVLVTKVDSEKGVQVSALFPDLKYDPVSQTAVLIRKPPENRGAGTILIVTAGTGDIPIAQEAAITAELMGNKVEKLFDVGVAGIHRVLARTDTLQQAAVIIVIAGMEGALASVVGGLTDRPVIAVPTSVGYGASFGGVAALLGMLNTCASGVAVVNIDNGFGAAAMASQINQLPAKLEAGKK